MVIDSQAAFVSIGQRNGLNKMSTENPPDTFLLSNSEVVLFSRVPPKVMGAAQLVKTIICDENHFYGIALVY